MFLIGIVPALLTIPIFLRVREPEKWKAAAAACGAGIRIGRFFPPARVAPRPLRQSPVAANTIVGMMLALAGVIGTVGHRLLQPGLDPLRLPPVVSRPKG